jgi:hypothetical protein
MRRKLFTLAAGVSAVLSIAAGVLWVRSYTRMDTLAAYWGRDDWGEISSERGSVLLAHASRNNLAASRMLRGFRSMSVPPKEWGGREVGAHWGGFGFYRHRSPPQAPWTNSTLLWFPEWLLMLGGAVLPLAFLTRRRRIRRRAASGSCLRCGYDLRATPERCPECGAVPVAKGAAACVGSSSRSRRRPGRDSFVN